MKRVKSKSLREYFRWDSSAIDNESNSGIKVRFRHWFHPLMLFMGIMLYMGFLGFAESMFWWADAALFLYLLLIYWQTRRAAQWIDVVRETPRRVLQGQELDITVTIHNQSRFTISDCVIRDEFSISSEKKKILWVEDPISASSSRKVSYKLTCDGTLGAQSFGPLQIILTDPLGIFEFRVIDDQEHYVEVVPDPKKQINFEAPVSLFSQPVANDVAPRPGDSPSFYELRAYVAGDPIKKIAWKLSSRYQKFLVKEFEEAASNDFSLFLDFDSKKHVGSRAMSTWGIMKEAALAFLFGEASGKRIQILSQNYQLPFGSGESHLAMATKGILDLEPGESIESPLLAMAAAGKLPYGSAVVYVGPSPVNDLDGFLKEIYALQGQGVRVSMLLIDSAALFSDESFAPFRSQTRTLIEGAEKNLESLKFALGQCGVRFKVIKIQELAA